MAKIIKEYFAEQIIQRSPTSPNADIATIGTTCILRFNGNRPLTTRTVAKLFNELSKDFGNRRAATITIGHDRIEIQAAPPSDAYKPLPPKIIGAVG